jgi:hypothetical protein
VKFRETIADRVANAAAQPVDPFDIVSEGVMGISEGGAVRWSK